MAESNSRQNSSNRHPRHGFKAMSRALRHRNYRLFFSGQSVSLIGTWLTRIATSWLVYRLTHSALLLGIVAFSAQIPTFFIAPFAGVLIDRWNRHRVLITTQTCAMIQSGLLAFFTLTGTITIWHILALSLFQGFINAFDMPSRQAFVVQMVEDRNDLPNAIALNSSMVNVARLIGPSIGGILIAAFGEGWCFLIDAVSYLAVIGSLLAMRLKRTHVLKSKNRRLKHELVEGFRYAAGSPTIRSLLMLLALVSLMGFPYMTLMPIIATKVMHGGADTLGALMGAAGLGALGGALYLASRKSVLGLGRSIVIASSTFGLGLAVFSRVHVLWLGLFVLIFAGAGMIVQMAATNTIIQTIVDEDKRGRVMSFYAMSFFGMAPVGALAAGWIASHIGAPDTILIGGLACFVGSMLFLRKLPAIRRHIRPTYVKLGILSQQ